MSPMPCDLTRIRLTLTTESTVPVFGKAAPGKPITVENALSAIVIPANMSTGLNDDDVARMIGHAVYIHLRVPFSAAGATPNSSTKQLNSFNSAETRLASAKVQVLASERCGQHPSFSIAQNHPVVSPAATALAAAKRGDNSGVIDLKIERRTLDLDGFKKMIFGGEWTSMFSPLAQEQQVNFTSCGQPSKGRSLPSASALVRLSSLNDWTLTISSGSGISLVFGTMKTVTRDRRGGTLRLIEKNRDGVKTSVSIGTESGTTKTIAIARNGVLDEAASKLGDSADTALVRNAQVKAASLDKPQIQGSDEDLPADSAIGAKLQTLSKLNRLLTIEVGLNGEKFSNKDVTSFIESLKEGVDTFLDTLTKLVTVLSEGLKVGVPFTVAIGYEIKANLLKGSFSARHWYEDAGAIVGQGYHVTGARSAMQAQCKIVLATIDFTFSASFIAQVLHRTILCIEVGIEITFSCTLDVAFSLSSGTSHPPITAGAMPGLLVKIFGEGNAGPAYIRAEGSLQGAVKLKKSWNFDGFSLVKNEAGSKFSSTQVVAKIEVFRGKVPAAWNPEGKGDPVYRYPKEGYMVLAKDQAWEGNL